MHGRTTHTGRVGINVWCLGMLLLLLCWRAGGQPAEPGVTSLDQRSTAPAKQASQTQTAEAYRNLGLEFLHKSDWNQAITNFTKAIRLEPRDAWTYDCRACAKDGKGDQAGAIADFKMALRIDPNYAGAYVDCGRLFQYEKHDLLVAIADYTEAIRLEPANVDTFLTRANAYLEQTNYDLAFSDFAAAIQIDPKNAVIYTSRAQAYHDQHQFDKALSDYNTSIQLNPTNANHWLLRGLFNTRMTNYTAAIADFTQCIQLKPNNFFNYYSRARAEEKAAKVFEKLGEQNKRNESLDQALADLHQSSELDAVGFEALGRFECARGHFEQGIADFTKCIQAYPTATSTFDYRAFAYEWVALDCAKRGDLAAQQTALDKALADWNQLVLLDTNLDSNAICLRGDFYARNNQYDRALSEYHHAIELLPTNNIWPYISLGWFLATCPDPAFRNGAEALAAVQRACAHNQTASADFLTALAAAYAETGDFAQAVKFQKQALQVMETEPHIYSEVFGAAYSDTLLADMQARLTLYERGKSCHRLLGMMVFE